MGVGLVCTCQGATLNCHLLYPFTFLIFGKYLSTDLIGTCASWSRGGTGQVHNVPLRQKTGQTLEERCAVP